MSTNHNAALDSHIRYIDELADQEPMMGMASKTYRMVYSDRIFNIAQGLSNVLDAMKSPLTVARRDECGLSAGWAMRSEDLKEGYVLTRVGGHIIRLGEGEFDQTLPEQYRLSNMVGRLTIGIGNRQPQPNTARSVDVLDGLRSLALRAAGVPM